MAPKRRSMRVTGQATLENGAISLQLEPMTPGAVPCVPVPTFDEVAGLVQEGTIQAHASRIPLCKAALLIQIVNIQNNLGLTTGWQGGWSAEAWEALKIWLAKKKRQRVLPGINPGMPAMPALPAPPPLLALPAPAPAADAPDPPPFLTLPAPAPAAEALGDMDEGDLEAGGDTDEKSADDGSPSTSTTSDSSDDDDDDDKDESDQEEGEWEAPKTDDEVIEEESDVKEDDEEGGVEEECGEGEDIDVIGDDSAVNEDDEGEGVEGNFIDVSALGWTGSDSEDIATSLMFIAEDLECPQHRVLWDSIVRNLDALHQAQRRRA